MNNKYQISIIIPIYNASIFIHKSIKSVMNQSYKNIELILVNDGSTDNSWTVLKKYKNKYKNIKIVTQKNYGAGVARNTGIDIATSEYIMFLDADDFLDKETCLSVIQSIKKTKNDFLSFGANFYNKRNTIKSTFEFKNSELRAPNILSTYLLGGDIKSVVWNKIYRKSFIDKFNIRFNKSRINEDSFFVMSACLYAKSISFSPGRFYNHTRLNAKSFSNAVTPDHFIQSVQVLNSEKGLLIETGNFLKYKKQFNIHAVKFLTYIIFMGAFSNLRFRIFLNGFNTIKQSSIWQESIDSKMVDFPISLKLRVILSSFSKILWLFGRLI